MMAAPVLQDVRGKITAGDLAGAAAYAEDFRKVGELKAELERSSWLPLKIRIQKNIHRSG